MINAVRFVIIILLFSSCLNDTNKNKFSFSNEKYYIIENINENDIIQSYTDVYDTNKMIFVKGGRFNFGSNNGLNREKPIQEVTIQSFLIDKNLVTTQDFRAFINESNYITEAEKFGDAIVYDDSIDIWKLVDGANWEFPLGKSKTISPNNHPVTQISWNDACAYCEFYDKNLPSELQWEYAASERGKKKNQLFYWGNNLKVDNNYMCNTWTSGYPNLIDSDDGFRYTSPTGYFKPNSLGIFDMAGNVWEWCSNWYLPYEGNSQMFPTDSQRAKRGGFFYVIQIIVMDLDFRQDLHQLQKVLFFMLDLDV